MTCPVLELTRTLVRRPSVTPADGGCQTLLAGRLAAAGFDCETMNFGEVANLWAVHGDGGPLLCFAGHTDVVPTGPADLWQHPPFEAVVTEGRLYGRGAADMKGSLAAMVIAAERFVAERPRHTGRLAFLLTSDEEGPAVDGTARVIRSLGERGQVIDYCIVGEPSSSVTLGDTLRIGRRGSLNATLRVKGVQGHVAFPHKADNPIHRLAPALAELCATRWDEGNGSFPPTSFQVSGIHAGAGATNVIPGELQVCFNFRYSTELTDELLIARTRALLDRHELRYELDWQLSGRPFLTGPGSLIEATRAAVSEIGNVEPELSTGGGTSDGRFIAPTGAQVVELGPLNETIHKIDENVCVADLSILSTMYRGVMDRLLP